MDFVLFQTWVARNAYGDQVSAKWLAASLTRVQGSNCSSSAKSVKTVTLSLRLVDKLLMKPERPTTTFLKVFLINLTEVYSTEAARVLQRLDSFNLNF